MKQDVNAISTAYRLHDQTAAVDTVVRQIIQVLDRETQLLHPGVVYRLRKIREAALRLHDLSVSGDVHASPATREPAIEHND